MELPLLRVVVEAREDWRPLRTGWCNLVRSLAQRMQVMEVLQETQITVKCFHYNMEVKCKRGGVSAIKGIGN